jgi:hypothetical protein
VNVVRCQPILTFHLDRAPALGDPNVATRWHNHLYRLRVFGIDLVDLRNAATIPHRLAFASQLESDLIDLMREAAPDAERDRAIPLHLAATTQALRDQGHNKVRPDILEKLLRGIAGDHDGGKGSIRTRRRASRNTFTVTLQRSWSVLGQTAELRRQAAEILANHLTGKVSKGTRGKDIQVETTMGDLLAALNGDALLRSAVQDPSKLMIRALLWLHEQEILSLGKGLTVFRPAMTVHLRPGGGPFTQKNFIPLEDHYAEQTIQAHVMSAYAERGMASMHQARLLSEDYFQLDRDNFLQRWLPQNCADRPPASRGRTLSTHLALKCSKRSSPMIVRPRMCLFWRGLVRARRGFWCIASPILSGSNAKTRAAFLCSAITGTLLPKFAPVCAI